MSPALNLSLAIGPYLHAWPIIHGEVPLRDIQIQSTRLPPAELFRRAIVDREFDICEMSLASHIAGTAMGNWPFVGIPVFPSRLLRHSMIFVRRDSGISAPGDLRGKRIGVPEYHMTAALAARGLLSDDYGVGAADIHWVQAGMWDAGRVERVELHLPPEIDLSIEPDKTLEGLLVAGDIDGVIGPYVPRAFSEDPEGPVRRLFEDPESAERDWLERTGVLPIMHLIVVSKAVFNEYPWVADSLLDGFRQAKEFVLDLLDFQGVSRLCLPFARYELERVRAYLGPDIWPYGVEANVTPLEAATRWAFEQGLTRRRLEIYELFQPA